MVLKSKLTEPLGLYGWRNIEPVILAALINEEPLLLVGSHGCAKSFLLERLAESLNMQFRSYNASLLNYDDLVGIPMPNDEHTSLTFISSPCSIWDAEVVFIDEINRTRPDLQNKLFPIIHECRIQGNDLPKLCYRWSAMNRADEADYSDDLYSGVEPLDAALADRFTFVIDVPDWGSLSNNDREEMLLDQFAGRHEFSVPIAKMINDGKAIYEQLKRHSALNLLSYIIILCDQLCAAGYDVSPRRSTMLLRSLMAVHAACQVLGDNSDDWYASAQLALRCSLPDRARRAINDAELMRICKHSWELALLDKDAPERRILILQTPEDKLHTLLKNAEAYNAEFISKIVTDEIAALEGSDRMMWALICYLKLRLINTVHATTIETLTEIIVEVFVPKVEFRKFYKNSKEAKIFDEIQNTLKQINEDNGECEMVHYTENLLYVMFNHFMTFEPEKVAIGFTSLWKELISPIIL